MDAQAIIQECGDLASSWKKRNEQFKAWYELITLVDKLEETDMESFCTNEPRTFFNLALHLLTPDKIVPRVPLGDVLPIDMEQVSVRESFLASQWLRMENLSMRRGRGGFLRELTSFALATGWISVISFATNNEIIAEVWNPAETYPEFYEEGVIRCAHIYPISGRAVKRKAKIKGWTLQNRYNDAEQLKAYDYWIVGDDGVMNGVVLGNDLVKPMTAETSMEKIPIYTLPMAGLPDRGSIITGDDWKKTIGQSAIATNESVYNSTNKLFTFLMQLLRDTAQTRWIEKSSGQAKVRQEDLNKRGALFHLGLNESLEPTQTPIIPVELRTFIFDVSAMRQKGSLPDIMFGGVQQQISGYLMQQIYGAALHILRPYHTALKFLCESLCNDWLDDIQKHGFAPYEAKISKKQLPQVEVDIRLDIPGDMVQRATVARMLDPEFSLSTQTTTDMLFPEIVNPLTEQARANRDRALRHPMMTVLNLIEALKQRSMILIQAGDSETAALYSKVASMLLQETGASQTQAPARPQRAPTPSQEVMPHEITETPLM